MVSDIETTVFVANAMVSDDRQCIGEF